MKVSSYKHLYQRGLAEVNLRINVPRANKSLARCTKSTKKIDGILIRTFAFENGTFFTQRVAPDNTYKTLIYDKNYNLAKTIEKKLDKNGKFFIETWDKVKDQGVKLSNEMVDSAKKTFIHKEINKAGPDALEKSGKLDYYSNGELEYSATLPKNELFA